jgi:phosphatidylserine decarboxylase
MTKAAALVKLVQNDSLNFFLTNRIPRRLAGRLVGRISRSENRLVRIAALWPWRGFTTIDLSDAQKDRFCSMHDLFTRRLRPGARPIDPDPQALTSPCDAIIGTTGTISQGQALQVKGMPYALAELLDDPALAAGLEGGSFVTLRLTSAMYHRFHAPSDCRVTAVRHVFGDCWNVNPPTLRRVARLFCRNERVVLRTVSRQTGRELILVAVAAILVSGIRLGFAELGPLPRGTVRRDLAVDAALEKGEEMGWFEHGSTIVVIAPDRLVLADGLQPGDHVRMGQALLRLPPG